MKNNSATLRCMPVFGIRLPPWLFLCDGEFYLVVILWLAHFFLLAAPFPLNYDSVNLALAISDHFNIAIHQPQPPGFLFHVFFGKLLFLFVKDPVTVTQLQSLIYLIITLLIIRRTIGRKPGQLLLFGSIPLVLFFCAASVMQAASIPFSAAVALLVVKTLQNNRSYLVEFAVVFAIGIGFRYDFAMFLGPVALFVTLRRKSRCMQWLLAALLFAGITLLWYIPTRTMSGNVSPLALTMEVQKTLSSGVSFVSGGSLPENIRCTLRFLLFLPGVFGIGTLIAILINFKNLSRQHKKIIFAALFPFFCMGIFIFMPLPQYYASVTTFITVFMMNVGQLHLRRPVMAGLIAANVVFFWIIPRPALPVGDFSGRNLTINILKQLSYTGSNGAAELLFNKKLMNVADRNFNSCRTFYSPLSWDRNWKYCAQTRWGNRFTANEDSAECILKYNYSGHGTIKEKLYPGFLIVKK